MAQDPPFALHDAVQLRDLGPNGLDAQPEAHGLDRETAIQLQHGEQLFGFTEGTDIGSPFQPEGEVEAVGRMGRTDGSYSATSLTASLKYPLGEHFRLAPSITFTRFDISGVTERERPKI